METMRELGTLPNLLLIDDPMILPNASEVLKRVDAFHRVLENRVLEKKEIPGVSALVAQLSGMAHPSKPYDELRADLDKLTGGK